MKEPVVAVLRLNHVSLRVRDLAASAKFYQDALQLPEIACGAGKPNIRWFGLGEGQSLHLIEGDFGKTFVTMSTHFCISTTDFAQALQHLRSTGIPFCNLAGEIGKEHVRADGQRSVYLRDPDGYWIEVNGDY